MTVSVEHYSVKKITVTCDVTPSDTLEIGDFTYNTCQILSKTRDEVTHEVVLSRQDVPALIAALKSWVEMAPGDFK